MRYTRRDFGKLALAGGAASQAGIAKPNSNFNGVQIGAITYSFRALPGSAEDTLKYCLECGISAVELMSNVAESYAGAPLPARPVFPMGPRPAGSAGGPPAGRPPITSQQRAAMEKSATELSKWRASASMDKYDEFRRMYEDAGVRIYCFKLPPTLAMPKEEYDYIWNVAETLGADHITMELPTDDALLQRVAEYAADRRLAIAFHTHGQGGSSGFDRVLGASSYTALNLDVGHYFGVTGESPVPVIEKYHHRIASVHLKDRKGPEFSGENRGPGRGGPNMPFGQGGTPLKEILQLMKREKYPFPGSIEYEYSTPEGSDVLTEMKKCVAFCQAALA
ncbi:MAG: sugar phosphate isomerase/epimerase [Bryobacterales bacterium]|nr:sugar phosphate isomerase/epimerase [Bryobacterales bacterium]